MAGAYTLNTVQLRCAFGLGIAYHLLCSFSEVFCLQQLIEQEMFVTPGCYYCHSVCSLLVTYLI